MNNSQRTVLWLGLILIALNLVLKWSSIKSIIFNGAGLSSAHSSSSSAPSSSANTPAPGAKTPNPQPNASPTPTSVIV